MRFTKFQIVISFLPFPQKGKKETPIASKTILRFPFLRKCYESNFEIAETNFNYAHLTTPSKPQ